MKWAEFKARTQEVGGAASRLLTGTSGNNMPSNTIPGTSLNNKSLAKWNDVGTVTKGVVDLANGAANIAGYIPGLETMVDVGGTIINTAEGDFEDASIYAGALLLPISGIEIKTGKKGLQIVIDEADKIDRTLLDAPTIHGNAPTFKADGTSVEIHHGGKNGPYQEMHKADHRLGPNYTKNHPDTHVPLTKAERKKFNNDRRDYWINEFFRK